MTRAAAFDIRRTFTIADLNAEIDGEPRINDLRLGEGLGFARPRVIRELVTRNKEELNTYGSLAVRHGKSRGQLFTEYFLNEGQALLICMFAKTVAAAAVRKALIDVFMEYRRGKIEKPVHVREHDRRTSTKIDDAIKLKRNIDRLETVADTIAPKPQNMCAMVIDGEPVWVDINKYDGAGRAVVLEHDGRVRIQDVEPEVINFKPFGARTALGQRFKSPFGGTARNSVAVIGMVIGAEKPAIQNAAAVQIEHEPVKQVALEPQYRGKRIKFRDKILQLIDETNLSNRQIAQVTGATYQTVTHWRRWRDDRVSA
ncbi:hypothetical protein WKW50_07295 [Ochrobactrum sp. GPK 3]